MQKYFLFFSAFYILPTKKSTAHMSGKIAKMHQKAAEEGSSCIVRNQTKTREEEQAAVESGSKREKIRTGYLD